MAAVLSPGDAPVTKSIQHQFGDTVNAAFMSRYLPWDHAEPSEMHRLWDTFLRWKLPILAFVTVLTSFAWIGSGLLTPRYEAITLLRLDGRDVDVTRPQSRDAYDRIDPVALETQVKAITASEIIADAARQVSLKYYSEFNEKLFQANDSHPGPFSGEERNATLLHAVSTAIKVEQVGASGIAALSVRSQDPVLAAHTANAIAENFIKYQTNQARARMIEALDALVAQQSELEKQLGAREDEIVRLQQEHGLVFSEEPHVASTLFGNLREMLIQSEADLAQAEQRYGVLGRKLGPAEAIKEISFSSLIQELRTERSKLIIEMTAISADIGSQHPRMVAAKKRLADINTIIDQEVDRLAAALRTETAALRRRVEMLRSHLDVLEGEARSKAQYSIRLTALVEHSGALRRSIETLKTQIDSIDADLGLQQSNVDFVSRAIPPAKPAFPKRKIIVGGAFVGATGVAGLFVLVMTPFDRRIRSFNQIGLMQALTGCTVVGALPSLQKRSRLPPMDARSSYLRSLKAIVGNLRLQHGSSVSIAVYPLTPGDGATTFVRALGLCCTRLEFRTLLIDLSVEGALARDLKAGREQVGEVIDDAEGGEGTVRDTCEPGMHVLHRPFDGRSQSVRNVIEQIADTYEVVIVDCPSLTDDANALQLARGLDHVLIVTAADMGRIDYLRFRLKMSLAAPALRPQIVLNRVDRADFML